MPDIPLHQALDSFPLHLHQMTAEKQKNGRYHQAAHHNYVHKVDRHLVRHLSQFGHERTLTDKERQVWLAHRHLQRHGEVSSDFHSLGQEGTASGVVQRDREAVAGTIYDGKDEPEGKLMGVYAHKARKKIYPQEHPDGAPRPMQSVYEETNTESVARVPYSDVKQNAYILGYINEEGEKIPVRMFPQDSLNQFQLQQQLEYIRTEFCEAVNQKPSDWGKKVIASGKSGTLLGYTGNGRGRYVEHEQRGGGKIVTKSPFKKIKDQ